MCKHNWIILLPKAETVREDLRIDYAVDKMLSQLSGIYYCDKCWHTGHVIKSHRSGMRRHFDGSWFIEKANKILEKYGLPLLTNEPNPERSATTDGAH